MIPALLQSVLIGYDIVQVFVALIAVVLAIQWKKFEFLPGLCFLFLYALVEAVDLFIFTLLQSEYIDIAQFGIILLAIVFFIIGMRPSGIAAGHFSGNQKNIPPGSSRQESVFSLLRKT